MRLRERLRAILKGAQARQAHRAGLELVAGSRFEEAIVEFERALEADRGLVASRVNLAACWYRLAVQREKGVLPAWLDEAEKHYRLVLETVPDQVSAVLGLAACCHARGRGGEAVALLEPLARRVPEHPDVNLNLALAYLAAGRRDDAVAALRQEFAVHPESAHAKELAEQLGVALPEG